MSPLGIVLLVLLILLLVGSGPWTGWHSYGYWPSGIPLLLIVILLILLFTGRL